MNIKDTLASFESNATGRGRRSITSKRAVAYVRVSTDEQQASPEAQESAIRTYAARAGLDLVAVVRDIAVSGGAALDERPGLIEVLEALLEHGAQVLLVSKRDRLARDAMRAAFVERLVERNGARVESADGVAGGDGPEDKLLRTLLDAFAEYERAMIRMRTRAAMNAKRRAGERVGQVPYGFLAGPDGKLLPEPREQAAIAHIVRLRAEGFTWPDITAAMNQSFAPAARGTRWHITSVQRIHARVVAGAQAA